MLGTLAKQAIFNGPEKIAIAHFETYTHQTASDQGCPCCGEPHSFWEKEISQEEYDKMFVDRTVTW